MSEASGTQPLTLAVDGNRDGGSGSSIRGSKSPSGQIRRLSAVERELSNGSAEEIAAEEKVARKDVLMWLGYACARAPVYLTLATFAGPLLTVLAEMACFEEDTSAPQADLLSNSTNGTNCRVWGVKTTSFWPMLSSIAGISATVIGPLLGSFADFTNYRKMCLVCESMRCMVTAPPVLSSSLCTHCRFSSIFDCE